MARNKNENKEEVQSAEETAATGSGQSSGPQDTHQVDDDKQAQAEQLPQPQDLAAQGEDSEPGEQQRQAEEEAAQAQPSAEEVEAQLETEAETAQHVAEEVQRRFAEENPHTVEPEAFYTQEAEDRYVFPLSVLTSDDVLLRQKATAAFNELRDSGRTANVTNNPGAGVLVLELTR